jgi:hypothetical protein
MDGRGLIKQVRRAASKAAAPVADKLADATLTVVSRLGTTLSKVEPWVKEQRAHLAEVVSHEATEVPEDAVSSMPKEAMRSSGRKMAPAEVSARKTRAPRPLRVKRGQKHR